MKRILSLILCLMMVLSLCLSPVLAGDTINESDAPVALDPSVNAYAAIVLDMKTGNVLYEYDADEKNYPASCTKIMTSLLCLKYGDLDETITITSDAFSDLSPLASTWNLTVGEEMTVRQLLKCVLVVSASEGANMVGAYVGGTLEKFVEMMNEEAQALGCENTHFMNCHGLPRSEHYTTARDLATIAMAAMEYEDFREIVGSAITELDATNYHRATSILSTNGLLPGSTEYGGRYNYPYAIGIKTGHTSVAGYNLVSAANKDGIEILTVVMGCGSRESSFSQTVKLFDWTYENYETLTWDWTDHDTEEAPEALEEAPEYEEIESSVVEDEEEVVIIAEGSEIPEAPESSAVESVPEAQESSALETVPEAQPPTEEAESTTETGLTLADLTSSSMMPVLLCFGIAILLLIVLIIILVVLLARRSKQKKSRKRGKKRRSR